MYKWHQNVRRNLISSSRFPRPPGFFWAYHRPFRMQNYTTGLGSAAHCGLIFRTGARPGSNQGSQHTCWSSIDPPNQNSIQWTPEMKTLHSTRLICRGAISDGISYGKLYCLNPITLSSGWQHHPCGSDHRQQHWHVAAAAHPKIRCNFLWWTSKAVLGRKKWVCHGTPKFPMGLIIILFPI